MAKPLLLVMLRERYGITNPYLCELAAIKMVGDLTDDPAFDLAHVIAMLKAMKPLLPDADNRDCCRQWSTRPVPTT